MKRPSLPAVVLVALIAVLAVGTLTQVDIIRSGLTAAVAGFEKKEMLCPKLTSTLLFDSRDNYKDTQVAQLQTFLARYYGVDEQKIVTGYFGSITYEHVVRFQKEHKLPTTGIVDVDTQNAIAVACKNVSTATTTVEALPAGAPTCTLKTGSGAYTLGRQITFYWTSEHATSVRFREDTKAADRLPLPESAREASGREYVKATVVGNRIVTLEASGPGGLGMCSTTVSVVAR